MGVRATCRTAGGASDNCQGIDEWDEACRRQWIDVTPRDYVKVTGHEIWYQGSYKGLPMLMKVLDLQSVQEVRHMTGIDLALRRAGRSF